jgi:archaellum component FlaC
MTIGATTGKEPDFIDDGDLKSLDEMRGAMKELHQAKLSLNQKATVEGVQTEIQVLKQSLEMTHEQLRHLISLYGTLRNEFDQFQQQRNKELTVRVNGGSTTPEDQ